jgi:hypothetical protein
MIDFAWRLAALVVAGLLAVLLVGLLIGIGLEFAANLFADPHPYSHHQNLRLAD